MEVSQWRNFKFRASLPQDMKNWPPITYLALYDLKMGFFCLDPAAVGFEALELRNWLKDGCLPYVV